MAATTETAPPALARGELARWNAGYQPMVDAEALQISLSSSLEGKWVEELTDNQFECLTAFAAKLDELVQSFWKPRD